MLLPLPYQYKDSYKGNVLWYRTVASDLDASKPNIAINRRWRTLLMLVDLSMKTKPWQLQTMPLIITNGNVESSHFRGQLRCTEIPVDVSSWPNRVPVQKPQKTGGYPLNKNAYFLYPGWVTPVSKKYKNFKRVKSELMTVGYYWIWSWHELK